MALETKFTRQQRWGYALLSRQKPVKHDAGNRFNLYAGARPGFEAGGNGIPVHVL